MCVIIPVVIIHTNAPGTMELGFLLSKNTHLICVMRVCVKSDI